MAISVTPEAPRATVDFCHILATGVADHAGDFEAGDPIRYVLEARGPSGQVLRSHEFSPTPGGEGQHQWNNLAFDEDGSWELALVDTSDSSDVETQALEVAAAS